MRFPSILSPFEELVSDETQNLASTRDEQITNEAYRPLGEAEVSPAEISVVTPATTSALAARSPPGSPGHALQRNQARHLLLCALEREDRNMSLPIARLPTEVMRYIFQSDADDHRMSPGERLEVDKTWLRLGNVCRLWRRIVFSMPEIWADDLFAFGKDRWMRALPLTKGAPLDVDLLWGCSLKDVGSDQDALSIVSRAWRISTSKSGEEDVRIIVDAVCSTSLPLFQTLTLNNPRNEEGGPPTTAQMAEHPRLQLLSLTNIYLAPSVHGRLSTLKVNLSGIKDYLKPSLDAVLQLLLGNTQLCTLELRHCYPAVRPGPGLTAPRVAFPFLSTFHLEYAFVDNSAEIFNYLWLPNLRYAKVHAQFLDLNSTLDVTRRLLAFSNSRSLFITAPGPPYHWAKLRRWGKFNLEPLAVELGICLAVKSSSRTLERPATFVIEQY
ncbi:unnamed protein product [Peniophora sp. CBMAI 1063]|nr:unnamed protein product [Peniophora sp. CBMAI 1063]